MKCECPGCNSLTPHKENRCRRVPKWYMEVHPVDACKGGSWTGGLCQQCFDATVMIAQAIIHWGLTDIRPIATCATCPQPLVRLSNIIKDVGRL